MKAPPTHRWFLPLLGPGFLGVVVFPRTVGLWVLGPGWSKAPKTVSLLPRGSLCSPWYLFLDEKDNRPEPGCFFFFSLFLYFYFWLEPLVLRKYLKLVFMDSRYLFLPQGVHWLKIFIFTLAIWAAAVLPYPLVSTMKELHVLETILK